MKKIIFLLLFIILGLSSCAKKLGATTSFTVDDTLDNVSDKTARVILLYGQSNATGCSHVNELQKHDLNIYNQYLNGFNNVKINFITENGSNSSNNMFITTSLGAGASKACFGPEVGIAEKFSEAYPTEDIFIIKYSWGGSILDNQWLNSKYQRGELYNASLNFTKASLNYLISKGYKIFLEGICWMQGESDSTSYRAKRYEKNTTQLVSFYRNDLSSYSNNIKFVDAYIEDIDAWKKHQKVNDAKLNFANQSSLNYVIDTIKLGLTTANEPEGNVDIAHYDSLSMVALGRAFGETLIGK